MRQFFAVLFLSLFLPTITLAQSVTTYEFNGSYEDAVFYVEDAIIGRGLVVDWISHISEMLDRTATDVGSTTVIYENAQTFLFCSASLSRKMMEADPMNIGYCPYGIFVAEIADGSGRVLVGYRNQPEGVMQEVQVLLDEIVQVAIE